jgi:hypothetical protein
MISWKLNKGELMAHHSGFVAVIKQHDKQMPMITLYHTDKTKNVTHRGKGKIKPIVPVWWITTQGGWDFRDYLKKSGPADFPQ